MAMSRLHWGIIGTGAIARAFAAALRQSETGALAAVASRTRAAADAFAARFPEARPHGSYAELLADPDVQAVYVATPHPFHAEWTIRALEAGKHVLCEKPLALNQWQAQAMVAAARRSGVLLAEAFMYRYHPQTAKLVELVRAGAIGEVRMIRAAFGFGGGDGIDPDSRLFSNALGGGAILDVGCYAVSAARLVAGAAVGRPFDNPARVAGAGRIGATQVDEWAAAVLQFDSGICAQVATAIRARLDNSLEIFGAEGRISVPNPWVADRQQPVPGRILVSRRDGTETMEVPAPATSFVLEADGVGRAVAAGACEPPPPAMGWADSLGNMAVLDAWRKDVGLVYAEERPDPRPRNIAGRPVRVRHAGLAHPMRYGSIPGIDRPVSRLILGALTARGSFAKAQVLFDHWLEHGGNAFDTAYIYGGGSCDRILGQWLASRGVRDEVVVVAKGAHTPYCDPASLARQLDESLDRMRTDHADLYLLHRDNAAVPAGEFVDVLNRLVRAGRIRAFGASNWSPERFAAANAYAAAHGLQGMAVLSNNLSLARMVEPVWDGCLHLSDPAGRAWLAANRVIHLAWSSQARGFFTERTERELRQPGTDPELRRCWISADNLRRRERCIELARARGVLPINVAAAWVLNQPFESYALIGPETLEELETSLPALDLRLSPEELDWLWGDEEPGRPPDPDPPR